MKQLILAICLLGLPCPIICAQNDSDQVRAAEWNNYQIPSTPFVRKTSAKKQIVFRVPVDWKQHGDELIFSGPHSSVLRVYTGTVPDGYALTDFVAQFMRGVDEASGVGDSLTSRRTQLQDLEAREVTFEVQNAEEETFRSTTWIILTGPLLVTINLQVPEAYAAEMEPYLKAVVQSVFFEGGVGSSNLFEDHLGALRNVAPRPVNELQAILSTLNDPNPSRAHSVDQLATIFVATPDLVLDLLLDRRPMVRAAAVEALARNTTPVTEPFLWDALTDSELTVAEPAARALAQVPDIKTKLLEHSSYGFATDLIARVWPFLSKEKRVDLFETCFSQTALIPAAASPGDLKPGVSVSVTELKAVSPGRPPQLANPSRDPNVQLGMLTLLAEEPVANIKLPLTRLIASNFDPLLIVGLQIANLRGEQLPVDSLLKLVSSANEHVRNLTLENFSFSAAASEIPRIETLRTKNPTLKQTEIELVIRKIQLRERLDAAIRSRQSSAEILKGLTDPRLADFGADYLERQAEPSDNQTRLSKVDFGIKPFAENVFPQSVIHYLALPNPGETMQRLYASLHSIQMDSPQAQSSLVLMMSGIRQMVGRQLSAPPDAPSLIEYTGIKPDSTVSMAEWSPIGTHSGPSNRVRKAIVLRINDRQRFERTLEVYQHGVGPFTDLTDYLGLSTRVMALLPAILPLSAKQVLAAKGEKPTNHPVLTYSSVGYRTIGGLETKIFVQRQLDADWDLNSSVTYLTVIGDYALLTPNAASIEELLQRLGSTGPTLANNESFKRIVRPDADAVYFSDIPSVFAKYGDAPKDGPQKLSESGALRISSASWDNLHRFDFAASEWSRHLMSFHPRELSAPRELLPNSAVAYFFMKLDLAGGWQEWSKTFVSRSLQNATQSILAVDINTDVVPELGPECGIALLRLPDLSTVDDLTWSAFCKLKTTKLSDALTNGKLFKNGAPASDIAEVKIDKSPYFVGTRNGFLIVSNRRNGVSALGQTPGLSIARDYAKAVEKVPSGVVAFGGYNLEAAVAAARNGLSIDGLKAQIADVIFSLTGAFHSQNFFATASADSVDAQSSVAMDREGKYAVSDLTLLPRGNNITYATLVPRGVPILDQQNVNRLVIKIHSKTSGPIESIRDDLKTTSQVAEQKSDTELLLTVAPRRDSDEAKLTLPVADPALSEFLKATNEISSTDKRVIEQARKIAGNDKDAWSVARKLADWTYKNLTWKVVADANASQTLQTREADCSEFSQLFVSMARSLGLPSRIVSGLAFGGGSFGGHAWVEVWVGKWVELDPTWGTHFVDATHIRNASHALVTAAALNLIDLEIVEARRTVADYQKSPRTLALELTKTMKKGDGLAVQTSTDLSLLTDELMGSGEWERMTDAERSQISSGYKRALLELKTDYSSDDGRGIRLLDVVQSGNRAEAICLTDNSELVKLHLMEKNDTWHLIEVVDKALGFHVISESLQPFITNIRKGRTGAGVKSVPRSDFVRTLLVRQSNPQKALELVDGALKTSPSNQDLKFLKAIVLRQLKKNDEERALLLELSDQTPPYPAAMIELGAEIGDSENGTKEVDFNAVIDLYRRYIQLEPSDPTGHASLAAAYAEAKEFESAESEYRKALDCDPENEGGYFNLVYFFLMNKKVDRIGSVFEYADKHVNGSVDMFGAVMSDLLSSEEYDAVETLAAGQPARLAHSASANTALGQALLTNGKPLKALTALNLALRLNKKSIETYEAIADSNRALGRWTAALKAADDAMKLDEKDEYPHYLRACALARLGRRVEAMSELNKSIELDDFRLETFQAEDDLKPLSKMPGYQKLVSDAEKAKAENKDPK